jgi:hypothetical protein
VLRLILVPVADRFVHWTRYPRRDSAGDVTILFLPRGVLSTLQDWLEERRAPRAAHADARTMEQQFAATVSTGEEYQPVEQKS